MKFVNPLGGRKCWESNLTKEQLLAVAGVEEVLAREDGSYDITIADPAVGKTLFDLATADLYPMFNQQRQR